LLHTILPEWGAQLVGDVFEEFALAIQRLLLIGAEARKYLAVGQKTQVQDSGAKGQGVEGIDTEGAGRGVEKPLLLVAAARRLRPPAAARRR